MKSIIVCGHYNCGGVIAAYKGKELGLIDNWLINIRDVYHSHYDEIHALETEEQRTDRLCELNVKKQVENVCHTTIVQSAWKRGQELTVSGVIYSVKDGLLKELDINHCSAEAMENAYLVK